MYKHRITTPMQNNKISTAVKNETFCVENDDIPPIPTPNTDIGHPLEPSHLGSSNEQPPSTARAETRKIMYTPANTSVLVQVCAQSTG